MAHRITEQEQQYIRDHAPHSTYAQVARELGLKHNSVAWWARMHGVPYNEDAVRAALVASARSSAADQEKSQKKYRKMSCIRKEMYRKERMRDKYGLTRQTNLKLCSIPAYIVDFRWRSKCRNGYILQDCRPADSDPYVIYYDENTLRYKNEARMAERYHVRFEPIEHYPE